MDSLTVLCIDDRPQVLEFRKATLESHGYSVNIAASGYTALKMLDETSVAAVLLEYKLEGMDAEAVAYHIKQRFPHLPIILLSAYSSTNHRIRSGMSNICLKLAGGAFLTSSPASHEPKLWIRGNKPYVFARRTEPTGRESFCYRY